MVAADGRLLHHLPGFPGACLATLGKQVSEHAGIDLSSRRRGVQQESGCGVGFDEQRDQNPSATASNTSAIDWMDVCSVRPAWLAR